MPEFIEVEEHLRHDTAELRALGWVEEDAGKPYVGGTQMAERVVRLVIDLPKGRVVRRGDYIVTEGVPASAVPTRL